MCGHHTYVFNIACHEYYDDLLLRTDLFKFEKKRNKCTDSLFFLQSTFTQNAILILENSMCSVISLSVYCTYSWISWWYRVQNTIIRWILRTCDRRTKNVFIRETIKCNFPHFQDFIAWRKWIIHIWADAYMYLVSFC